MIISGKEIAEKVILGIQGNITNKKVCFVSFGENEASKKFVELKARMARSLGVEADIIEEKEIDLTEEALLCLSSILEKKYDGVVIQLPLPPGVDVGTLLDVLSYDVDIDMLSQESKSRFRDKFTERMPPVAEAVDQILKEGKVDLQNKNIVILGKGRLVGEVVGLLFERDGVSFCSIDEETPHQEKEDLLKNADVIISGIGQPYFLKPEMVKEGVVLIDAGTSGEEGKLKGDIDPSCEDKASLFTPVPGGVGPITIASLFANLMRI